MTRPGEEKRAWHLLPLRLVGLVVDVLQDCAAGRGEFGWQTRDPVEHEEAIIRHLDRRQAGQLRDRSGHLASAHIAARALMLLWHDAFVPGASESELRALDERAP